MNRIGESSETLVIVCLFIACCRLVAAIPNFLPMNDIRVRFGLRVRQLRSAKGWSQEHFADRCGLHRTYIGSIERGEQNISLVNIEKVAATLGIPLAELFSTFTEPPPSTEG